MNNARSPRHRCFAPLRHNEQPRSMTASLLFAAAVTVSIAAQTPARPGPPTTTARPVVDTYHGIQVTDPYRWLERWDDSDVKAWTDAQNTYTHAQLDALPFMAERLAQTADQYAFLFWQLGMKVSIR